MSLHVEASSEFLCVALLVGIDLFHCVLDSANTQARREMEPNRALK